MSLGIDVLHTINADRGFQKNLDSQMINSMTKFIEKGQGINRQKLEVDETGRIR